MAHACLGAFGQKHPCVVERRIAVCKRLNADDAHACALSGEHPYRGSHNALALVRRIEGDREAHVGPLGGHHVNGADRRSVGRAAYVQRGADGGVRGRGHQMRAAGCFA